MNVHENAARTAKAQAIAATLLAVKVDAGRAETLPEIIWQLAAQTGWYVAHTAGEQVTARPWSDASPATRREVIDLLVGAGAIR